MLVSPTSSFTLPEKYPKDLALEWPMETRTPMELKKQPLSSTAVRAPPIASISSKKHHYKRKTNKNGEKIKIRETQ